MKILRTLVAVLLMASVASSALAGDLQSSVAKAGEQQGQSSETGSRPMPKLYLWAGTGLFAGGMAVGVYGFLRNRNGQYPNINEATATNKPLGAAGLATAFAGGTLLFLGQRQATRSAELRVTPGGVALAKTVSW